MYHVTCCKEYHHVGSSSDKDAAMAICMEHECGDYDCFVSLDSKMIGDKSGWYSREVLRDEPYTDAATQTGMYDAW